MWLCEPTARLARSEAVASRSTTVWAGGWRANDSTASKPSFHKAYGFGLVTAALFLRARTGQLVNQMMTVRAENAQHGQPSEWTDSLSQVFASTFENWQSGLLYLVWQAAGLTLLLFWGPSQ
jgi:hypothetical protein